ncbi:MAG TPA: DUF2807 domain-containing protein [Flavobacterium sp.]|jgi:hypothetical protein
MLKIITTLSMLLIGALAQAQVTEVRPISAFSEIAVSDGIEVVYTNEARLSLVTESEDVQGLRNIRTELDGNTLVISRAEKDGKASRVIISASGITAIQANSGSTIKVNELTGKSVSVAIAGGACFSGNIIADQINLKARNRSTINARIDGFALKGNFTTSSRINLSGSAHEAVLNADSKVFCTARNLKTGRMTANATGLSEIEAQATKEIHLSLSEASKITYYGNPERVSLPKDAMTYARNNIRASLTSK